MSIEYKLEMVRLVEMFLHLKQAPLLSKQYRQSIEDEVKRQGDGSFSPIL